MSRTPYSGRINENYISTDIKGGRMISDEIGPAKHIAKDTGTQAVRAMRDEFLALVACYNAVGLYEHAQHAQQMAIALNMFEEKHVITAIGWPPALAVHPISLERMIADPYGEGISTEEL